MRWDPTLTFGDSARLIEDELGLTGSLRMGSMDYAPNTIFM